MKLRVNGDDVELPDGLDVAALLRRLGRDPDVESVAVAVNLEVVPKQDLARRRLSDGDRIDVVAAVGGG